MALNRNLLRGPVTDAAIVASDLEGTLTEGATWTGLRGWLEANGQKKVFQHFLRQRLGKVILFRLGLIRDTQSFKEGWLSAMYELFADFTAEEFDDVADYVVEKELWPRRRQEVVAEFLAQQSDGRRLLLVTGVNEPVLARFAQKLGGIEAIGTPLQFQDGVFTGKTAAPLNTGRHKVTQLEPFLQEGSLAVAYGDTAADIPMLELASEPVAVYPDKQLRETAVANGWRIVEGPE